MSYLGDIAVNAIGGLIAATVLYFVIEHRLRLRRERRHRVEISRDILETLREELEHNREVARQLSRHLPEGALPYDAFELGGWTLMSQVPVITTLEPQTVRKLFEVYRGLRGANEQHALLLDLMYGPTATLSTLFATSSMTGESSDGRERIEKRRAGLRDRLVRRVDALQPYLDSALQQIHQELSSSYDSALVRQPSVQPN